MHTDDLGAKMHTNGNVLWEAIQDGFFGASSVQANVEACWAAYCDFCSRTGVECQCEPFTLDYFNKKDATAYPLMGHKAMEGRELLPFTYLVAAAMNDGSEHAVLREACTYALLRKQQIESTHESLTPEELQEYNLSVTTFLTLYDALSEEAKRNGINAWHIVPKFHFLQHIAEIFAALENPHRVACYGGESLMLIVRRVGAGCHMATFAFSLLLRLRVSLVYRWSRLTNELAIVPI